MAKYKFALNSKDETVSAGDIANKPVDDVYHCLGCGNELTAKVNGQVKNLILHIKYKLNVVVKPICITWGSKHFTRLI